MTFCKKDIRSHLGTIKVGQTSLQTVRDLILACTGHLRKDGGNMTIYPAHRACILAALEKMCAPCAWKSEGQAMEGR